MKTLELNQMEKITASGDGRDCLIRGAGTALGLLLGLGGQVWGFAAALGITSTSSHCID